MKPISDKDLVHGIIRRDKECLLTFQERFRKLIYESIDLICQELSISPPKTDAAKEKLYLALCDHLHSDNDSQLKDYLAQERECSLENWLVNVKLPAFLPDKIVVDGLLNYDREITTMFVSATNEHSLKGMINIDYLSTVIRDYDHGGAPMDPQTLICEIFSLIMIGEETKKDKGPEDVGKSLRNFRFDSSLKSYITNLLRPLPRYTKYYRGQTGREDELTDKHERIPLPVIEVGSDELKVFIQKVFCTMTLTEKGKRDAELLDEYYLQEMKQKDMAILHGVTVADMNQKVNRARKSFRDVCCQHFGATTFYQIEEHYGKD